MSESTFDLVVIGSGPAGQKGAISAAKQRKRVAIVDRKETVGGVCLHTGTIPSKTLREAILYLSGFRQRSFYGRDYSLKEDVAVADLSFRVAAVLEREMEIVRAQLKRNGITQFHGHAHFVDAHTVEITGADGVVQAVRAENFLIACGTRPAHNPTVPIDGERVLDSDQLLRMQTLPRELIVVGAGVVGLEYASMLTALDIEVTLIEQRPTMLDFVDAELIEALSYFLRQRGATLRLGERVLSVESDAGRVTAVLESGKRVHGDALLYTVGRQTNADRLNLAAIGIEPDERGRVTVDEHFCTVVPHVYAAGDVIGFPALASTSMDQGRLAARHMFGAPGPEQKGPTPYGIYAIPEISMVGKTEQQLTAEKVPYEVGRAKYEELAKGQMLGAEIGLLKILFCPQTLKIYGVHAFGEGSTEIIHIGQAVMALGGTMTYFRDTVFNYPTMAEAYKVAGLDGLNKL